LVKWIEGMAKRPVRSARTGRGVPHSGKEVGGLDQPKLSWHSCTDALTRPRVSKTLGVSRVELGVDGVQNHWIH
jgi:hypothetical protein